MKLAKDTIKIYRPCFDSLEWLGERSVEEMVNECHRGDWLLWLGKKAGIDIHKLTLAKALYAQQVEHLMKDQRSKDAVQTAIRFGNHEATREELDAAAAAAADAAAAAASFAVAYAADAAYAAYAARSNSLKKSSDICREVFGSELIEILNSNQNTNEI